MSKYTGLRKLLEAQEGDARFSFQELEETLNIDLPKSARTYREWWGNTEQNSHAAKGWMAAGYKVAAVDLDTEEVHFTPTSGGMRIVDNEEVEDIFHPTIESARDFEAFARDAMADHLLEPLAPGRPDEVPKLFDFMSRDGRVVGDAKYYSMVNGTSIPPAKFSTIAEHVWLLERTPAERRFLVFGNDRRVPEEWLKRYGHLVASVEFYFLDASREPELLNG